MDDTEQNYVPPVIEPTTEDMTAQPLPVTEPEPAIEPTPEPTAEPEVQPEPADTTDADRIADLEAQVAALQRDKEALIHELATGNPDGYEHVTIQDLIARGDNKPAPEPGTDLSTSQL